MCYYAYEAGQDRVLDVKGAWEKMLQTIRYLNGAECFVRVNTTLTRFNYMDLSRLAYYFKTDMKVRKTRPLNAQGIVPQGVGA